MSKSSQDILYSSTGWRDLQSYYGGFDVAIATNVGYLGAFRHSEIRLDTCKEGTQVSGSERVSPVLRKQFFGGWGEPLSVASVITEHMSSMLQFLSKYFPNLNINNEYNWIKTPFSTSLKYDHIPWAIKEQLIEIREDSTLEFEFHEKELSEFWLRRQQEYPLISKAALLILIPFASTYLCETAFSQLQIIKNQHRSCLSQHSLEANLRIAVSNITPDINMLCKNIQAHPSH
ncbi:hypothetical protein QTP88_024670 [Uroleucon formosanum]